MEITNLKINNFLTIGNADPLNLSNQGLVLIQGQNLDDSSAISNGAGKSSIVDALCWVLYGSTARDITGDGVVNETAKKDCYVSVTLQDGDSFYSITRTRKHATHGNKTIVMAWSSTSSEQVDISKGTEKETQGIIETIVGCTLEVFKAAIYAGQEDMPDLPKMKDKALKMLLEEAVGSEHLEKAYEIARAELSEANKALERLQATETAVRAEMVANDAKLAQQKLRFDDFEAGRQGRVDAMKAEAINYINDAKKEKASLSLHPSMADLQAKLDAPNKVKEIMAQERAQLHDLNVAASNAKTTHDKAKFAMDAIASQAQVMKNNFDNAETEMLKPCVTCGKPHDPSEIEEFKEHAEKGYHEALGLFKQAQTNYSKAKEEFELIASKVDAFKAAMTDGSEMLEEVKRVTVEMDTVRIITAKVEALTRKAQECVESSKRIATEANPYLVTVDMLTKDIEANQARITEVLLEIEEAQKKVEVATAATKVFGPAGVRAQILDTITPFLNERTAEYLSALSDGNISAVWTTLTKTASGELREKFNIEVSNDKGGKSFNSISGGEKRKVRLATMLALQDLVASRATKPIGVWLGDEIDDALDDAGLERLMGILDRKARERGTVLIVSHNALTDWCDNILTITKKDGYSTIEGALCV